MLFDAGRLLLCRPDFFDVTYEINPWMSIKRTPHVARTQLQWQTLHHTLIRAGVWVEYVAPQRGLPDMVFTANAGLVRGKCAVLARFRHRERQGEEPHFREWFIRHDYKVVEVHNGCFEGEGDALFAGTKLFCGYGFRSDESAFPDVANAFEVRELVLCKLTDPYFYHLDTCFCPLSAELGIFYPRAFSPDSVTKMRAEIELLEVPEQDAKKFACNAVVLGKTVVMPAGCEETKRMLESRGYIVHAVELDEFMKAGGAAKCLVLKLE